MFSFYSFLKEARAPKKPKPEGKGNVSNDKGKLFEILHAAHLKSIMNGSDHLSLPTHPIVGNKTPEELHQQLKSRTSDSDYARIYNDAKKSAELTHQHLLNHIKEKTRSNDYKLHNVHWISVPGEIDKITKKNEGNNPSDILATFKNKKTGELHHVGLSLKYGSSSNTNDANRGITEVAKDAGVSVEKLKNHMQPTMNLVKKYNIKNHEDFKTFRDSSDPERKKVAEEIKKQSIEDRKKIARSLSQGMSTLSDSQLRDHIRKVASPSTSTPYFKIQALTKSNQTYHNINSPRETVDNHLNNYSNIHIDQHNGNSLLVRFMGTNKKTGQRELIADYAIHHGGRPSQESNVAIFRIRKKKNRG